jgi:hypothetical protein
MIARRVSSISSVACSTNQSELGSFPASKIGRIRGIEPWYCTCHVPGQAERLRHTLRGEKSRVAPPLRSPSAESGYYHLRLRTAGEEHLHRVLAIQRLRDLVELGDE